MRDDQREAAVRVVMGVADVGERKRDERQQQSRRDQR
jgi:hypothetical protein